MPALDHCHDQVVRALQKEGWQIVRSPSNFDVVYRVIYIDLEMTRPINGNRESARFVEVKCFPEKHGATRDLYSALGQYLVYQEVLSELGIYDKLYLVIPLPSFSTLIDPAVSRIIRRNSIKMIVIDLENEVIDQWIE